MKESAPATNCGTVSSHRTVELNASEYEFVDVNCSKTNSHKTVELKDSEYDSNQRNYKNITEK